MTFIQKEIHVKNVVCRRCVRVAREELSRIGVKAEEISMGHFRITYDDTSASLGSLRRVLESNGFELLENKDMVTTERIKILLREALDNLHLHTRRKKLSDLISETLHSNYMHLSRTFSKVEGITIERYFIRLKIEKTKELIGYDELSFKEIAFDLGYSSLQHLSGQFRQVTGMSMTQYKQLSTGERKGLDEI